VGQVWTRAKWNDIIQRVNNLGSGCTSVSPLSPVGPNHIWTRSDIQAVQNALKAICSTATFGAIPPLWKQSTIDEINNAITRSCQDCGQSSSHYCWETRKYWIWYAGNPPPFAQWVLVDSGGPYPYTMAGYNAAQAAGQAAAASVAPQTTVDRYGISWSWVSAYGLHLC
jgi:hypothetical protein